jgi:transcriptional regulator
MYKPAHSQKQTSQEVFELMRRYPFVSLISTDAEGFPFVSHVPVHIEVTNGELQWIEGHLALQNPHVELLKNNPKARVVFNGPHSYISPLWYKSGRDVPTWNYCVAHATGIVEFDASFEGICRNLVNLTKDFEKGPDGWKFYLPADLKTSEQITSAIISFKIRPEKVECKFKISLNRPTVDIESVINELQKQSDDNSLSIAAYMQSQFKATFTIR